MIRIRTSLKQWQMLLVSAIWLAATPLHADDTEVYFVEAQGGGTANIMIMLDTSGSMNWCGATSSTCSDPSQTRIAELKRSFSRLVDGLGSNVRIGLGRLTEHSDSSGWNGGYVIYPMRGLDEATETLLAQSAVASNLDDAAQAVAWARTHARRHGGDPSRLYVAGHSAGAQIAAQLAAALADPAYATRLGLRPAVPLEAVRGVALFCGPYDLRLFDYEGRLGPVLRTAIHAFTGRPGLDDNPAIDLASVLHHVSPRFPPAFITVGNADPLLRHSVLLDERLRALGVPVDTLYFPSERLPALGHEYQFNLDDPAGLEALERLVAFLRARTAGP